MTVKVLRRLADTATLENMKVDAHSDNYVTLSHLGGVGVLEGMDLKPNEKSKVTVTYSIPEDTPDETTQYLLRN